MPLFWRLFWANAATLIGAAVLLLVTPFQITFPPSPHQVFALLVGVLVILIIDVAVLGRSLAPLVDLREGIERARTLDPDQRLAVEGPDEVAGVAAAYNEMLDRLEVERTASARITLRAQEEERARIARELHDEVGQTMTFLLLRLQAVADHAPAEMQDDVATVAEGVRTALEEVRTISRRLRPGALEDVGIGPALRALMDDVERLAHVQTETHVPSGLQPDTERDLVLYRVAQEALTNVVKHAHAGRVSLVLEHTPPKVVLTIADDGIGAGERDGTGTYSMKERARLVGGRFRRTSAIGVGTTLVLEVPEVCTPAETPLETPTRPLPRVTVFPPPVWLEPEGEHPSSDE